MGKSRYKFKSNEDVARLPGAVGMDRLAHDRSQAGQQAQMLIQHVFVGAGRARLRYLRVCVARFGVTIDYILIM